MMLELFAEMFVILLLVGGMLYLVLDAKAVITWLVASVCSVILLVVAGFFMGIGIHYTNLFFGW